MLVLSSNTIKVLGIFGRLSSEQEAFFDRIEAQYSKKPEGDEYDIFRHLTLTFIPNARVNDINQQLIILKELRQFLPLKVRAKNIFVKDEESLPGAEHIAVEFEPSETSVAIPQVNNPIIIPSTNTITIIALVFRLNLHFLIKNLIAGSSKRDITNAIKKGI